MSRLPTTSMIGRGPAKPPKSGKWLIIGGAIAVATIAVIAIVCSVLLTGPGSTPAPVAADKAPAAKDLPTPLAAQSALKTEASATTQSPAVAQTPEPQNTGPSIVDDDGKTLWESPTHGKPLDLAYLSPGAQLIVYLRPAALSKHAEAEKIRAALGPVGQNAIESVEKITELPLAKMDRLVVGCQTAGDNQWVESYVVHSADPLTADSIQAKLPNAAEKEHGGRKYSVADGRAYYLPGGAAANVLVVAPEDAIGDIIDLAGQMPPLRRDIERLIGHTDGDRQVTIVLAPNSLFGEGESIFSGEMIRLRGPSFWFFGDELSGAALSLDWGKNFFLEFMAAPTLETSTDKAARIFSERVAQIPSKVEEYVVGLNPQPFGRLVVARFPEMLRRLATYTRSGFDGDQAVLRCYLPVVAGHNLLLAAELTLAESTTSQPASALATDNGAAAAAAPTSIKAKLARVTSLKFAKDTLESALDQLSQDVGVPIVIRGPDLQADGITKNQSFGIDLANKPAEEILVEILHLANPDKTSPGTHDSRQKLVYIIEKKPDKTEQVVVTTRARAKERHDELPAAFQPEKP